jgi:ribosome biogenesis GTPase
MSELEAPARVVVNFGRQAVLETAAGERVECKILGRKLRPVCGDEVEWKRLDDGGLITGILPRRSLLARHDVRTHQQPLAANVDRILVVTAPEPEPDPWMLDRYLAAARASSIEASLLLNKSDLPGAADPAVREVLAEFRQLGHPVLEVSAETGAGMPELEAHLREHIAVLVGQSGVGKSSLVRRLTGTESIRVGEISEATGEGRHTTTSTHLFHLPGGGDLIDSPGVRDFTLWPMEIAELATLFEEFVPLAPHCRFADCLHLREPGCAVKAAVEKGAISERRYTSYKRLANFMRQNFTPWNR